MKAVACVSVLTIMLAANPARAVDIVTKAKVMTATFYHDRYDGRRMAGGDIFRQSDPHVAATGPRGYPLGTRLRLVNPRNGRVLEVRVCDRGKFSANNLDLSKAGYQQLGLTSSTNMLVTPIK